MPRKLKNIFINNKRISEHSFYLNKKKYKPFSNSKLNLINSGTYRWEPLDSLGLYRCIQILPQWSRYAVTKRNIYYDT